MLYLALSAIATALVLVSAMLTESLMNGSWIPFSVRNVITIFVAVCVAIPAFSLGFIVRDLLLRRRVRTVIQSQGVCKHCGYLLLGMRVPSDLKLTCPECGDVTTVNPALDTLAPDPASGEARFQGRNEPILPSFFWTRSRRRVFNVLALITLLGPPTGYGVWWLYREIDLRIQASHAKELLATTANFRAYYRSIVTKYDPTALTGESAYDRAQKIYDLLKIAEMVAVLEAPEQPGPERKERYIVMHFISNPQDMPQSLSPEDQLSQDLCVRDTERVIELLDLSEIQSLARSFSTMKGRQQPFDDLDSDDFFEPFYGSRKQSSSDLGVLRQLAHFAAAKMRLAADRSDRESFCTWLIFGLQNARLSCEQRTLFSSSVGVAIERMMFVQISRALGRGMPKQWLGDIADILRRYDENTVSLTEVCEGERVLSHEMVCLFWSDPRNIKEYPSFRLRSALWGVSGERCGRLTENLREIDDYHRWLQSVINERGFQRPYPPFIESGANLLFVNMSIESFEYRLQNIEFELFDRRIVQIAIAIERFRAQHGQLPDTLEQLVPAFINEIPNDPLNPRPISYAKADAKISPCGFVLYLWGDNQDNQGTPNTGGQTRGLRGFTNLAPGTDYILFPDLNTQ
ncbi:MAG: hypothetical protein IBJ18_01385 [Phycisphaerales bacterium]|nr:hypothetical protein [Phycisphaerales bacterium]